MQPIEQNIQSNFQNSTIIKKQEYKEQQEIKLIVETQQEEEEGLKEDNEIVENIENVENVENIVQVDLNVNEKDKKTYENNNAKLSHWCYLRSTNSSSSDSSSSESSDSDSDESYSIPNNTKIHSHDIRKKPSTSHPRKKCSGSTSN